ncbi:hypothetical protein OU798_01840 [Prolixibacteraceae bacterium Z1-6]|uniref:Adhesin domain-containing protein n=1 Tax=Draconibacterium aestuarii TaxID=2998507 RepID=A0A9X3F247_9BACT|nr:hypothetical protein [Prolixibacteraceae bacterium Z1-6]
MKTIKLIAAFFVLSILAVSTNARAEEKTKEYNESWPVASVSALDISNRFGEVRINNDGGNEVSIDVVITVEAANEKKSNELLDKIEVQFRKSGSTVFAVTKIESDFKSQKKFSIDYVVNIPSDKNLKIANKYGNTVVGTLTADGDFDIKYGNFTAYDLNTPESGNLALALAYGNGNIGAASHLNLEVSYSPVTIEEVKSIKVQSKYSTLNIEEGGDIQLDSKYDKFNFEEINSLTATTKYSHISIDELAKSLKVESGYGGIKVGEIATDFEFINISNSYGQISLGLNSENYALDASCDYCGISYPEEDFTGDRMKENNSRTVKGIIGSGEGGKVTIRSRYGEIKLTE